MKKIFMIFISTILIIPIVLSFLNIESGHEISGSTSSGGNFLIENGYILGYSISKGPGREYTEDNYNLYICNDIFCPRFYLATTTTLPICVGTETLHCDVPGAGIGNERKWKASDCGRISAEIDCDNKPLNSHYVCEDPDTGPCSFIEPSVSNYSVSSKKLSLGESFSTSVSGFCPSNLPGNCLVECRVEHPDGHKIYLDTWDDDGSSDLSTIPCDQDGVFTVEYCLVYTDFVINSGWGDINDTDTNIVCGSATTETTTTEPTTTIEPSTGFEVWAERTGLFTIGKPEVAIVYVKNFGPDDSYTVNVTSEYLFQGHDLSHLINVYMLSNKTGIVKSKGIGSTQAMVTLLGPVSPPGGSVTFTVESDTTGDQEVASIDITSGYPASLPEFETIGMIMFIVFATLFYFLSKQRI